LKKLNYQIPHNLMNDHLSYLSKLTIFLKFSSIIILGIELD